MPTITFRRASNIQNIPITDGQIIFDTSRNIILMDNGNVRNQYAGATQLISTTPEATNTNAFNAQATTQLFLQKTTVIDTKANALAVTQNYIPLGCLAFKEALGTTNYSDVGNGTISGALVTLKNNNDKLYNQLFANNKQFYFDYQNGKYGYNTDPNRGADTFIPFNDGKVYMYCTVNGNTTFTSPVSGNIYCYLTSNAAQIQWNQEDTSVSITNKVLKNGTVICDCSGSQHDSDRDAWVSRSNSYSGTVNEGDTIAVQKSGGGNYLGYATQLVIIIDGSIESL